MVGGQFLMLYEKRATLSFELKRKERMVTLVVRQKFRRFHLNRTLRRLLHHSIRLRRGNELNKVLEFVAAQTRRVQVLGKFLKECSGRLLGW